MCIIVPLLPNVQDKHVEVAWTGNISNDSDYWVNRTCAEYYGISCITGIDPTRWKTVYENGDPALMNCQTLPEYLPILSQGNYAFIMTLHSDDVALYEEFLLAFGLSVENTDGPVDYIAAWDGAVVHQQTENHGLVYADTLGGISVYAISTGKGSSILCNGQESSCNNGSLNLVVIDKNTAQIADSVSLHPQDGTLSLLRLHNGTDIEES